MTPLNQAEEVRPFSAHRAPCSIDEVQRHVMSSLQGTWVVRTSILYRGPVALPLAASGCEGMHCGETDLCGHIPSLGVRIRISYPTPRDSLHSILYV